MALISKYYSQCPERNLQMGRVLDPLWDYRDTATTSGGRVFKRGVVLLAAIPVLALMLIEGVGKLLIAPVGHWVGPKERTVNRLAQAAISLFALVLVPYWILTVEDPAQWAAQ